MNDYDPCGLDVGLRRRYNEAVAEVARLTDFVLELSAEIGDLKDELAYWINNS